MKVAFIVPDNRDEFRRYDDPDPYFGPAPSALLEGFTAIPELEIHIVCCVQKPLRSPERIAENIYYHSIVVPKSGWLRGLYIGCVSALRRKLRELQPALVHGQGTERYCAISAVLSGFPNVVTIHGNMRQIARVYQAKPLSFHWLTAKLESFTLSRTGGVFCNSAHTERTVSSLAKRTWRVPNALQSSFFSVPITERPANVRPVLLGLGVISDNKQQVTILNLAERLWAEGYDFELQFAGPLDARSPYGALFQNRLRNLEAGERVRYLGNKSLDELIVCMDAADALIHCPIEEAFGLVVAEALARNLKFFGTRSGGVGDIAEGVEGAELFAPGDWEGLAGAIRSWFTNGSPRPSSAAPEMKRRYHPDAIAKEHLRIYRELLNSR